MGSKLRGQKRMLTADEVEELETMTIDLLHRAWSVEAADKSKKSGA